MPRICLLVASALLLSVASFAQETTTEPAKIIVQESPAALNSEPGALIALQGGDAVYMRTMIFSDEVVKNAPYTATATTETTQVLGDGNRIVNKSSAFIARDSQGRTRREENFGGVGGLHVEGGKVTFISDPTTSTDYILNPNEQSARVVKRKELQREEPQAGQLRKKLSEEQMKRISSETSAEYKHESLGTQVIEGVSCEGRRETKIIPAGAIGNEHPLEITSESWTSTDLHVLVLRKRNDPRLGETVYHLTNIKLGEPDASLFQVPSGYKTTAITEPRPPRE